MHKEQIGDCTLYEGDCRDILPTLGRVDAVVTDPPYGIGFSKYESHKDDVDEYEEMMREVIRMATDLGPHTQAYWQGMTNADKWHKWFPNGFRIFAACKGFVQIRPVAVQYSWDPVIFWTNRKAKASATSPKDWSIQLLAPFGANRPRVDHPCPRPLEQCQYVVCAMSADNEIVADPFMGSGTTGVACATSGRKFIGIECEPKYFDIACKRIEDAYKQPDLFVEPAKPPAEQLALLD